MRIDGTDVTQMVARGLGDWVYRGPEGSIARGKNQGCILTDITDGQTLIRVLRQLDLPGAELFCVKSEEAARALCADFGCHGSEVCSQWVYTSIRPPSAGGRDIRPLEPAHREFVVEHYHLSAEDAGYADERIAAGQMWGIWVEDQLAGFIGLHTEGSTGMLEILPQFRRQGLALALEGYAIDWQLARGWVPYSHVVQGNEKSARLQARLGMEKCAQPAIWVY